jgi:N-acetylmuramoyl-L-alanine amidase
VDGICGRETWGALVEAGYQLGDRLLYLRQPMLRGDDVAQLQRQVGSLGFDAGRVDAIFGPNTELALREFQRNTGLPVDGVCGPSTLQALARLTGRAARQADTVVAAVRETESLRRGPRTLAERRVVVGQPGGLHALTTAITRALARLGAVATAVAHADPSDQAAAANSTGADVFVGVQIAADHTGCTTAYYARPDYESAAGRRLAEQLQGIMPHVLGVPDGGVHGLTLPVLRETRMPAVLCELGPPAVVVERTGAVAEAVAQALRQWAAAPCEGLEDTA